MITIVEIHCDEANVRSQACDWDAFFALSIGDAEQNGKLTAGQA